MALSVGIFRHRSHRPTQHAIRKKFIVPTVFQPPPPVPAPGWLEETIHRRAYSFIKRYRIPPEVRWQLRRAFPQRAPPTTLGQHEPGYLAALYKRRVEMRSLVYRPDPEVRWQLKRHQRRWVVPSVFVEPPAAPAPGWLEHHIKRRSELRNLVYRPIPDVRWQLKRHQRRWVVPAVTPPSVIETPGFLAAIRNQRTQFYRVRPIPEVRWQITRPRSFTVTPPVAVETPGWLAEHYRRRVILRSLVAREPVDVRWQLHPRFIATGVVVPPTPADIGWLVSYMKKRGYGHNLRR